MLSKIRIFGVIGIQNFFLMYTNCFKNNWIDCGFYHSENNVGQYAFCLFSEKKIRKDLWCHLLMKWSFTYFNSIFNVLISEMEKENYTKNELTIWKLLQAKMILKVSCSVDNLLAKVVNLIRYAFLMNMSCNEWIQC